jgi:hypothetical protein
VGFNLWWARNDGIGGHAWLSFEEMRALVDEMRAQGFEWEAERPSVGVYEVARVAETASQEPSTAVDPRLWRDWLAFLDGAKEKGGLVVR